MSCSPCHNTDQKLQENLTRKPLKSSLKTKFKERTQVVQNMLYETAGGIQVLIIDGISLETWAKMLITHMEGYKHAMVNTLAKEKYLGFNLESHISANTRMCQDLFRDKLDILWNYMINDDRGDRFIYHFYNSALGFMDVYGSWGYLKEIKLPEAIKHYYDEKGVIAKSKVIPTTDSLKISFAISAATILCITSVVSNKMHIKALRTFLNILYEHFHSKALEISATYDE